MARKYLETRPNERIDWNDLHDETLVTTEVAAQLLGVSVPFIKKWSALKFPIYKIGSASRFKVGDLRTYLESCRIDEIN